MKNVLFVVLITLSAIASSCFFFGICYLIHCFIAFEWNVITLGAWHRFAMLLYAMFSMALGVAFCMCDVLVWLEEKLFER